MPSFVLLQCLLLALYLEVHDDEKSFVIYLNFPQHFNQLILSTNNQ